MGEIGAEEMVDWDKLQAVGNGGEEKILVLVRLRPLSETEILHNEVSDWECINSTTILYRNSLQERSGLPTATSFDRVFRGDNTTLEVYNEGGIKDIALSVVGGINSTIFAYGQTSSGKTYTMNGITEYAVADILEYTKQHGERTFLLKFSAIEIYNEVVKDLLNADNNAALRLLDDPERGTVIDGLTEETLRDWDHLKALLAICEEQRKIGETLLNEASSRSHQILRLTIESSAKEFMGNSSSTTLAAAVNFVDLAGSERASQALSVGQRLKEGCHINRSLLTLGTVIRKLSKGRHGHVNYRDSKLTRILQPALGGNARTAIICTLSPARSHVEQSRNTILFASCAKEVSTNARVNIVMSDKALVKHLQKEVARLESELRTPVSATACDYATLLKKKDAQIEKLEKENKELKKQLDLAHSRIEDLLHGIEDYNGSQVTNGGLVSNGTSGPLLSENSQDNYSFEEISLDELKRGKPDDSVPPSTTSSETQSGNNHVIGLLASTASSRNDDEKKTRCVHKTGVPLNQFTDPSSPSVHSGITTDTGSLTLRRSNSCKANIMLNSCDSEMVEVEQNVTTPTTVLEQNFTGGITAAARKHWKLPPVIYGATHGSALSRNDSQCSGYSSFIDSTIEDENRDEDVPTLGSFVAGLKDLAKTNCENQSKQQGATDEQNSVDIDLKNWPARFKKIRNQIIELWEACHVSLVHRTYFFLLVKQELTDSIYMEVEHRRLTFLRERFSRGQSILQDGKVITLASSKKALNREREMLSRMISKKYCEEERNRLYEEWGVAMNSKRRRLQLARRLWNNNGSLNDVAKSASIVGKLIGFLEHGHTLEEMLGLKFAPLPPISRRSFGWKSSVTSVRY